MTDFPQPSPHQIKAGVPPRAITVITTPSAPEVLVTNFPAPAQTNLFTFHPALNSIPAHFPAVVTNSNPNPNPLVMVETWVDLEDWCRRNSLGPPQKITFPNSTAFSFSTPRGYVAFTIGSILASLGGMQFHFGYPPILINGHPYVHRLDIGKNLNALLEAPQNYSTNRVIVIDPGHGGRDKGARNVFNGSSEKDFTLDWALRLRAILVTNGWKVWLTRSNDVYLTLAERIMFADLHNPDLFLSLHFNSSLRDREVTGLETFCVTPTGLPSTETRGNVDNINLAFPNNQFDIENMQLAWRLHHAILKINGETDRGLRHARFLTVLREQHRPAVLVEGGFLSNPAEARRIADPDYREQLAQSAAVALTEHSGPLQTASTNPPSPAPAHP